MLQQEVQFHALQMTKILVIDDHPIIVQGCCQLLQDAGLGMALEANSVAAGVRAFHRFSPDVVIVDLGLDGNELSGLELIERLRAADSKISVLVFSMHRDPVIISRALAAGATGYLVKDSAATQLVDAVRAVAAGRPYIDHDVAVELAWASHKKEPSLMADLNTRELQVLTMLSKGKSYNEIAKNLRVSYKTVVNTSSTLKARLGARTLSELIRLAVEFFSDARNQGHARI
jgi:two-component system, NarL family, invasion response regulator UvrY